MKKKNKLIIFFLGFFALFLVAHFVSAQDFGVDVVDNNLGGTLGESGSDPRVLIARIIQIALSFLGLIALVLILYAGFLWMSSSGNEDKIDKAKSILKNALIGLVIILSSWAIVTYIISRFTGSLGSAINPTFNTSSSIPRVSTLGALGACTIESVYPENKQIDVPRNTAITIKFKEPIDQTSVCVNDAGDSCSCGEVISGETCNLINPQAIRIFKTELEDACIGNSCPEANANFTNVTASISQDKLSLILTPKEYLGSPSENIWYSVKLSSDLRKEGGKSMLANCQSTSFAWSFEVSSRLDLIPPQVVYGSIYPLPDNEKDLINQVIPAVAAQAKITVLNCPNVYSSSSILNIIPSTNSPEASASALNYQGDITSFLVVIPSQSKDKAQLFEAEDISNLLGVGDFDSQGNVRLGDFFIFKAPERSVGNSWIVNLKSEVKADTLTIGSYTYTFDNKTGGNNISLPVNCNSAAAADAIYIGLSGDSLVDVLKENNSIVLRSKIAGPDGNNIKLESSSLGNLQIEPFSGGVSRDASVKLNDQKDVPMNTVLQLNFNEPVNPLQIAGLSSEVASFIRVVNYEQNSKGDGVTCFSNSECKSYNCSGTDQDKKCVGDYLPGKFLVSNNYKTVEFISDKECGVNGCGEKIYCLPASSHLAVELRSADLKVCESDDDCLALSPFNKCLPSDLGYTTCQNSENRNYPIAKLDSVGANGIIDLASNSFDGNRNKFSEGPLDYYNDNYIFSDSSNNNKRDNYRFSFYVNDQINLTPPKITSISPAQNKRGVALSEDIKITWNTLMMNSTLKTGQSMVDTGKSKVAHKLVNLMGSNISGLGYWISNDNNDTDLDGEPDQTISWIKHSELLEAMTYRVQVGSGVRDIYQNCFKPSDGEGCTGVSLEHPSCCFGEATDILNSDGSCQ